jgi:predicted transcriptional regulator
MSLTNSSQVKKFARALINEGRKNSPHGFKLTQIGEDFLRLAERHMREFIEKQVEAQKRQKRLGDPLADLTPGQRAAMKPVKRRRRR